ncbi:NAD(P)H-dependent flavin oxidoreductase [Yinghuangia seranimata]|uniref:NAD(P)H-dependent flavin oxidoreductase n=1 Tax=Yinghuangia seranimata TaxID=408067 RepID=UPI00248BF26E|nr:nitronate monooxygenase [Yinghuangia seranimata]MDI2127469.1 nitronate monooxygenase [Yinghuangia seranimata]
MSADSVWRTPVPVVQAPMAGGASGPALAAAVSRAGGLGFLAAGYKTAEAMGAEVRELRELVGDRPFGVNLFVPGASDPGVVDRELPVYRARLASEAERLGAELGDVPPYGVSDDWHAKTALLLAEPVPVVSFTFGCPPVELVDAFRAAGTATVVTVTTAREAELAAGVRPDVLVVQGAEAGAHQGRWDNASDEPYGLLTLLALVRAVTDLPLIAAGGLMTGRQIAAVLAAGGSAAQLGTAFLRCPECAAPAPYKAALADPCFTATRLTRAFSGRPARGLVNRFLTEHDAYAPAAYPEVHYATAPVRRAAAAAGDPEAMALWAGQGWRLAREEPAADVLARLAAELREVFGPWRTPAEPPGPAPAGILPDLRRLPGADDLPGGRATP